MRKLRFECLERRDLMAAVIELSIPGPYEIGPGPHTVVVTDQVTGITVSVPLCVVGVGPIGIRVTESEADAHFTQETGMRGEIPSDLILQLLDNVCTDLDKHNMVDLRDLRIEFEDRLGQQIGPPVEFVKGLHQIVTGTWTFEGFDLLEVDSVKVFSVKYDLWCADRPGSGGEIRNP